jgi:hypothetical protein
VRNAAAVPEKAHAAQREHAAQARHETEPSAALQPVSASMGEVVTRWTATEIAHLTARVVSISGAIGRPVPIISKFRNRITLEDGIKFRSARESERYKELKLMQQSGAIMSLKLQPRYPLELNGVKLTTYVADFEYVDCASEGSLVVEDVKGAHTPLYTLKKRLMRAIHGIDITELS